MTTGFQDYLQPDAYGGYDPEYVESNDAMIVFEPVPTWTVHRLSCLLVDEPLHRLAAQLFKPLQVWLLGGDILLTRGDSSVDGNAV